MNKFTTGQWVKSTRLNDNVLFLRYSNLGPLALVFHDQEAGGSDVLSPLDDLSPIVPQTFDEWVNTTPTGLPTINGRAAYEAGQASITGTINPAPVKGEQAVPCIPSTVPDPGAGYFLIDKEKDGPKRDTDEFWYESRGRWEMVHNADGDFSGAPFYRRRIDSASSDKEGGEVPDGYEKIIDPNHVITADDRMFGIIGWMQCRGLVGRTVQHCLDVNGPCDFFRPLQSSPTPVSTEQAKSAVSVPTTELRVPIESCVEFLKLCDKLFAWDCKSESGLEEANQRYPKQ